MIRPKIIKQIQLKTITIEGNLGRFLINKYDNNTIVIHRRILTDESLNSQVVRKFGNKFLMMDTFSFKEDTFHTIAYLLNQFKNNDTPEIIKSNIRPKNV